MPSSTAKKPCERSALGEFLRNLGAIALGDASDQRFLGREVAVEIAGAHPGLGADVLHGGAMEAGTHEATLRRRKDFGAAVGLGLDIGATQSKPPFLRCGI